MWGPGAIVHVFNILPFAGYFMWLFAFRYNNLLGTSPNAHRRNQYRQFWVRLFFGRYNYTFFSLVGFFYLIDRYRKGHYEKVQQYLFTSYLNESEEFDEEENPQAHTALVAAMYRNNYESARLSILKNRALINHDLKIQAFNEFAEIYDNLK
jgi:hypothetical protein